LSDAALPDAVPPGVRRVFDAWHRVECAVAVAVFAAIVLLLMGDVFGRAARKPQVARSARGVRSATLPDGLHRRGVS
jgi:hypothetical protein